MHANDNGSSKAKLEFLTAAVSCQAMTFLWLYHLPTLPSSQRWIQINFSPTSRLALLVCPDFRLCVPAGPQRRSLNRAGLSPRGTGLPRLCVLCQPCSLRRISPWQGTTCSFCRELRMSGLKMNSQKLVKFEGSGLAATYSFCRVWLIRGKLVLAFPTSSRPKINVEITFLAESILSAYADLFQFGQFFHLTMQNNRNLCCI